MINLLTPERQQELLKEYRHRRRRVASTLALIGFGIALLLLVILFSRLQATKKEVSALIAQTPSKETNDNDLALKEATRTLVIARNVKKSSATAWWEAVFPNRTSGLIITDWQWFADNTSGPAHVSIAGRASQRQALIDFVTTLKQDKIFSTVESPISNLIKNRDLDFTIELTINPDEK
ncbi:hypothetical protein IT398_00975 [Candidatus Nomurabacteria bacterium]|nr:hypothetical protein [Candidatus Nomurabacteria bacterium]